MYSPGVVELRLISRFLAVTISSAASTHTTELSVFLKMSYFGFIDTPTGRDVRRRRRLFRCCSFCQERNARQSGFCAEGLTYARKYARRKMLWRALQSLPIRSRAHPVWARTTWREARGESTEAQRGIIRTVVNRAAKAGWWGTDVASVILKFFQFSSLNLNDPRRCKRRMK